MPDIERLPSNTRLERRAAPDGGIEFSCPAPAMRGDGVWAWQAKYLHRIDNSAIQQMRQSLLAAVKSVPTLTRYAFVLPIDRSATGNSRQLSALERWHNAVNRWRKETAKLGRAVEIVYIGHSEVLAALQLDKHAGAVRYFFDTTLFTEDFFAQQVHREVDNLGQRYDPAVNVELEIKDHMHATARTPAFAHRISDAVVAVVQAAGHVAQQLEESPPELAPHVGDVGRAADALERDLSRVHERLTEPDDSALIGLEASVSRLNGALAVLAASVGEQLEALPDLAETTARRKPTMTRRVGARTRTGREDIKHRRSALYELSQSVWKASGQVEQAQALLRSDISKVARSGAILISGPAGCGKSHLVADVALNRIAAGQPTLLLLGQRLHSAEIWPQVTQQLDLQMSGRDLLAAFGVAAQVRRQGKALLIIDAINEGAGADVWPEQLSGFLRDVAANPWVAVALTLRDTYRRDVLPTTVQLVEVTHPGLAGHEEEALRRYAEHYDLRLPDFPPLLPELSNPLFLRSLCRSVKARGHDAIPREASSLTWVFDGLLAAANDAVSGRRRLDRDTSDNIVGQAVDALATRMLEADDETLPTATARKICQTIHPEQRASRSLLHALIADGLLLQERFHDRSKDRTVDRVRFTYQRMADHTRAEALLGRHPENVDLADAVLELATRPGSWRRRGLIESLVLLTGERRGVELANLVGVKPGRQRRSREDDALRRLFADSFFAALPWRAPSTFRDETMELLQRYLRSGAIDDTTWLTLLISLATVPDHPLNVRRIDATLQQLPMPDRDAHWSFEVLSIASDDANPVSRTIDWAWSAAPTTDRDVVELTATLLTWFLTSPNRHLRDTTTKALLHLTLPHTELLASLVRKFAAVDDIYIKERLLAVVCGHAVRHAAVHPFTGQSAQQMASLARAVYDVTFVGQPPAHLLLRYYARTALEVIDQGLRRSGTMLDRDLSRASPPYHSPWPLTAPSKRELAIRYERRPSPYLFAVCELGSDFERYVLNRLSEDFVLPNQARRQAARRAHLGRALANAREALLANAADTRRAITQRRLDAALNTKDWRNLQAAWDDLRQHLPRRLHAQVNEVRLLAARRAAVADHPFRPDPDLLGRWVAARVLEIGWTPERFRTIDKQLANARSYGWSQTERFGKKYAWISFYELAGHLADRCEVGGHWYDDVPKPYEGPWQLSYVEDIDPTTQLRGDQPPDDSPAGRLRVQRIANDRRGAWWLCDLEQHLHVGGRDDDWLRDPTDMPTIPANTSTVDPSGDEWLTLNLDVSWRVPNNTPTQRWHEDRRLLTLRTRSFLVKDAEPASTAKWAMTGLWAGGALPEFMDPHVPFVMGYPDIEPWPTTMRQFNDDHNMPDGWFALDSIGPGARAANAVSGCVNTSSRDYSNKDYSQVWIPASQLLSILDVKWCGDADAARALQLGPYETEYSWAVGKRIVAFTSAGPAYGSPQALYVRKRDLESALAAAGWTLVTTLYAEKVHWRDGEPSADRGEMHASVVRDAQGHEISATAHIVQVWRDGRRLEERLT